MNTTLILTLIITILLRLWNTELVRTKIFARVAALPRMLQWLPPVVLGVLAAAGQGYLDGIRGSALVEAALKSGGEIGVMAIGIWHSAKRLPIAQLLQVLQATKQPDPVAMVTNLPTRQESSPPTPPPLPPNPPAAA
jgi:hypothetical protein